MRKTVLRVARSQYARDVKSQLHIIPWSLGGAAAAFVIIAMPHWLAAILIGWVLIAVAMGVPIGRAIRKPEPAYEPPTSTPMPSNDWMALVSVDCLRDDDPLLHERFAALIGAEWEWSE